MNEKEADQYVRDHWNEPQEQYQSEPWYFKLGRWIFRNAKYTKRTVDSPRDPTVTVTVRVGNTLVTEFWNTITVITPSNRKVLNKGDFWYNWYMFIMDCVRANWEEKNAIDERDGYGSLSQYE